MSEDSRFDSHALNAAAEKRVELKLALSLVEVAAAAPSANEGWQATLLAGLEELRQALDEHIREVEADDGLLAELTSDAPRLANQISRVRDEHPELCRDVNATMEIVRDGSDIDAARAKVLDTLTAVARHRQKGADLVYEGYSVDIGGH